MLGRNFDHRVGIFDQTSWLRTLALRHWLSGRLVDQGHQFLHRRLKNKILAIENALGPKLKKFFGAWSISYSDTLGFVTVSHPSIIFTSKIWQLLCFAHSCRSD